MKVKAIFRLFAIAGNKYFTNTSYIIFEAHKMCYESCILVPYTYYQMIPLSLWLSRSRQIVANTCNVFLKYLKLSANYNGSMVDI